MVAALLRRPGADLATLRSRLVDARDVGRRLARDGAGVTEALRTLRLSTSAGRGREPRPAEVEALVEGWVEGWVEATLGHLCRLSCEDPLTGLATMAHLRTRVAEQRRAGLDPAQAHALVVVTPVGRTSPGGAGVGGGGPSPGSSLGLALRCAALGERVRVAFSGAEPVVGAAGGRVVVLADRDGRLEGLVALLRRWLAEDGWSVSVVLHPLPQGELELVLLLERLDLG